MFLLVQDHLSLHCSKCKDLVKGFGKCDVTTDVWGSALVIRYGFNTSPHTAGVVVVCKVLLKVHLGIFVGQYVT